eukprot:7468442-Pyramimonas_sp.AAC.1
MATEPCCCVTCNAGPIKANREPTEGPGPTERPKPKGAVPRQGEGRKGPLEPRRAAGGCLQGASAPRHYSARQLWTP